MIHLNLIKKSETYSGKPESQQDITCADVVPLLEKYGMKCRINTINAWENGRNTISGVQLLLLCQIYNIRDIYSVFIEEPGSDSLNKEGLDKLEDYRKILVASGLFKTENTKSDNVVPFPATRLQIPLYIMAVSAGTGELLDDDDHDMINIPEEIPENVLPEDIDFAVRIHGDSMEPRFSDQQIIYIHKCEEINDGDIGVFYLDGNAFCKKFHQTKNRNITHFP
jgi:Predicted transcriptional regulator